MRFFALAGVADRFPAGYREQKKATLNNRVAPNDCLPYKKAYFFVVSLAILEESLLILVESIAILEESADILEESAFTVEVESAGFESEPALLHAANAPIANTNNSFFIVMILCVN
jgi:hypothetical protein